MNIIPKLSKLSGAVIFSALLFSCSENDLNNPDSNTNASVDNIYVSINLISNSLGGSTRALPDGNETGMTSENEIKNARIILTEKVKTTSDYTDGSDQVIYKVVSYADIPDASMITQDEEKTSGTNSKVTVIGSFNYNQLKAYMDTKTNSNDDTKVSFYVFVVANYGNNIGMRAPLLGEDVQQAITFSTNEMNSEFALYPRHVYPSAKGQEMTNVSPAETSFSVKDLAEANTKDAAYKLKKDNSNLTIELQRSTARIDLDWTHLKFKYTSTGKFELVNPSDSQSEDADFIEYNDASDAIYTVTIDAVALANMSRDYYLFQETSEDTQSWTFLGQEQNGDTPWFIRDSKANDKLMYDDIFYQSLKTIDPAYGHKLSDFLGDRAYYNFIDINSFASPANRKNNNISGLHTASGINNSDYAVWHYALPNSIYPASQQLKKNCTAVIYRAKLESDLIDFANGKDLYAFGSDIYGSYEQFRNSTDENPAAQFRNIWSQYFMDVNQTIQDLQYAINDLTARIDKATAENVKNDLLKQKNEREIWLEQMKAEYKRIHKLSEDPASWTETIPEDFNLTEATVSDIEYVYGIFKQSCLKNQFTIYSSVSDGNSGYSYYCYYFYWIRHADNNNEITMGPMEFSIVRNYIYKLSVKGINSLGYPDEPQDDPDPMDPDDEIESPDTFIDIQAMILPWGVRSDENIYLK